jgi:hypothetical protein
MQAFSFFFSVFTPLDHLENIFLFASLQLHSQTKTISIKNVGGAFSPPHPCTPQSYAYSCTHGNEKQCNVNFFLTQL